MGIFSKKQQPIEKIEKVETIEMTVEQIHNEFDTASKRIMEYAKNISEQKETERFNRAKRLANIGFNQAKDVKNAQIKEGFITNHETLYKQMLYLCNKYPFHKFITATEIGKICEKIWSCFYRNYKLYR